MVAGRFRDTCLVFFVNVFAAIRLCCGLPETDCMSGRGVRPEDTGKRFTAGDVAELTALVSAAVEMYRKESFTTKPVFSTAFFLYAVKERYELTGTPGAKWAADLLLSLPFVKPDNGPFWWAG